MASKLKSRVIVYNKGARKIEDYEQRSKLALGMVTLKHAIGMLVRGVAEPLDHVEGEYVGTYRRVTAVELVNELATVMVYQFTGRVMFSKENMLIRDHYTCAYCGRTGNTVDHIWPQSKGGRTSWENCITACYACNQAKANLTLEEAGMRLNFDPYVPDLADLGMVLSRRKLIVTKAATA